MSFANDCLENAQVCVNDLLFVQGQQRVAGVIDFQLRDYRTGNPLDIDQYLNPSSSSSSSMSSFSSQTGDRADGCWLLLKDYATNQVFYLAKQLTIVNAALGQVRLTTDETDLDVAGMYLGVVEIWKDNARRKLIPLYFEVEPSLTADQKYRPLTIAEVRLALRDSCPDLNFLLDAQEYADKEIAFMIRRAVDFWNETPPPIIQYTPITFPYHFHWMEAVIGQLQLSVSTWKLRNHLQYTAGGVTVDDTSRWKDYLEQGQLRWQTYQAWVRNKKIEINVAGAYVTLASPYSAPDTASWWGVR